MRARETAAARGLAARVDERLRDCDFGRWTGLRFQQLLFKEPRKLVSWMRDPSSAPHGGESIPQVLARVAAWIDEQRSRKQPGIITCSALKRSYRQIIIGDRPEVRLVYLRGGKSLIAEHLAGRHGHFMPPSLLQSQIDTLEEPDPSEDALIIDEGVPPGRTPAQIAGEIIHLLGASATVVSNVAPTR